MRRSILIGVALAWMGGQAYAVSCPANPVSVQVCLNNLTGAQQTVTFSGSATTRTCTTGDASYTSNNVPMNSGHNCVTISTANGMQTGIWKHTIQYSARINGSTGTVTQVQVGPVLYGAGTSGDPLSNVEWTFFPDVVTVRSTTDTAPPDYCSAGTNCGTACNLRSAICRANAISTSTNPVLIQFEVAAGTITMTDNRALTISGANIMIDGTNSGGRPWVVGDSYATQDSFSWTVDLNNTTYFSVASDKNTIQGLWIKNSNAVSQANTLVDISSGKGNVVKTVKLDGGNTCTVAADCPCTSQPCPDLIHVASGNPTPGMQGVTVRNTEALSARDQGLEVSGGGQALVKDSWFHHNLRGGLRTFKGRLVAERNIAELEGRKFGGTGAPFTTADGLTSYGDTGGTARLETDANISRQNSNNAVSVKDNNNPLAAAKNDYLCGSSAKGVGINNPGTVTGQGVAAVYNGSGGVYTSTSVSSGTVDFGSTGGSPGNNAFAQNASSCDFEHNGSITVNANNNQWGPSGTPQKCGTNAAGITTTTIQDGPGATLSLDSTAPTIPSNIFQVNQTIRVRGGGFNAIAGNPAPAGGDCVRGNPDSTGTSCCLVKPPASNACSSLHTAGAGNCVELQDYQATGGAWYSTSPKAVTPTTIVTTIPAGGSGGGIPCQGGTNTERGQVEVTKIGPGGQVHIAGWFCTNVSQKDQL